MSGRQTRRWRSSGLGMAESLPVECLAAQLQLSARCLTLLRRRAPSGQRRTGALSAARGTCCDCLQSGCCPPTCTADHLVYAGLPVLSRSLSSLTEQPSHCTFSHACKSPRWRPPCRSLTQKARTPPPDRCPLNHTRASRESRIHRPQLKSECQKTCI